VIDVLKVSSVVMVTLLVLQGDQCTRERGRDKLAEQAAQWPHGDLHPNVRPALPVNLKVAEPLLARGSEAPNGTESEVCCITSTERCTGQGSRTRTRTG
jgi:hypothetical protein